MPVATKNSLLHEISHQISALHLDPNGEEDHYEVPSVDIGLFEEIAQLMEQAETYKREEEEAKKSVEQLDFALQAAADILSKAEEKKEALVKKNRYLEGKLVDQEKNIKMALNYWKEYGVDVRRMHQSDDPYEQYEFVFANLNRRRRNKKSTTADASSQPSSDGQSSGQGGDNTPGTKNQQAACSVKLRYQDRKLELVGQVPEILSAENLLQLNEKLTHHCVNQGNGLVNYRSAMALIRKDLIRDSPSSKTGSHPPTETNIHTCTSPAAPSSMS